MSRIDHADTVTEITDIGPTTNLHTCVSNRCTTVTVVKHIKNIKPKRMSENVKFERNRSVILLELARRLWK